MTPQSLLIALRVLNIRVRLDGDLIRCKAPAGAEIPADLAVQIRAVKPGLLDLLREEQTEIDWRAESGLLREPVAVKMPGACSYCGVKMPAAQTGRCVLCCLAAAQRYEAGRPTYPLSPVVVENSEAKRISWDMTPARTEAA